MNWRDEIIDLHRFFEDWFLGRGGEMKRAEDALHPDFSFIGPDGVVADRATTLQRLVDGHAHTTDLTIETVDGNLVVCMTDNGRGVPEDPGPDEPSRTGRGLRNLEARAADLGGSFLIRSGIGGGTEVEWAVPLSGAGGHS